MIYLGIFALLSILALCYDFGNARRGANVNYWLACALLVALAGFRYKVGGDTYNYMYAYELLPSLDNLFDTEVDIAKFQPLWLLLNAITKSISEEFFAFQILHAVLVNGVIFSHIKGNTKYKFTAILIYYFAIYPYFNFEILRESLAICCFLLGFKYLKISRWVPYYCWVLVAFLFHQSAFFLVFLPLVKKSDIKVYFIWLIFLEASLLNPFVLSWLSSSSAFSFFATVDNYKNYTYTYFGLAFIFVSYVLYPSILIKFARSELKVQSPYYDIVKIGILVGSLVPLLFIFYRFVNYFSLFYMMLAVEILHGLARAKRWRGLAPAAVPAVFALLLGFYMTKYFSDQSDLVDSARWYRRWYPYYSIFEDKVDPMRESLIEAGRR